MPRAITTAGRTRATKSVLVRGELAAILAHGAGKKKPDRGGLAVAEQIEVVAGARNHRQFPVCVAV